jgi:monofunctional biosynthetic peptidoglycan transglycosylase
MRLRFRRKPGRRRTGGKKRRSRLLRVIVSMAGAAAVLLASSVLATLLLRWVPPISSAMMVERQLAALFRGQKYYPTYEWARWDRISPAAPLAVIAAEDQRFADHNGFDLESLQKALDDHERGRRLRGASTISQQVAKNLFLWSGRSFVRKGLEAYFTVLIETLWPKRRILEVYLNIAEMGDGVWGVQAASRRYFGKPASGLTAREAALLAAVLPNPRRLRANRPSAYVEERRAWILRQMEQLGGTAYIRQF